MTLEPINQSTAASAAETLAAATAAAALPTRAAAIAIRYIQYSKAG